MHPQKVQESSADIAPNPAGQVRPYRITSIEETEVPNGGSDASHWYSYVVENGISTISGIRRGTRQEVAEYATGFVEELNVRRVSPFTPLRPASRKKKR